MITDFVSKSDDRPRDRHEVFIGNKIDYREFSREMEAGVKATLPPQVNPGKSPEPVFSAAEIDRLRALGYVQ